MEEASRRRCRRDRFGGEIFKDRSEVRAPPGVGAAPDRSRWRVHYNMSRWAGRCVHEDRASSDDYGHAIEIDVWLTQGADGFRTAAFDGAGVHQEDLVF